MYWGWKKLLSNNEEKPTELKYKFHYRIELSER